LTMELERYISDNSLKLFGLADKSIVDFVLASASTAKSPDALFNLLKGAGLPDSSDAHAFISEVYSRAPRKSKHKHKDAARKQAENEAKSLVNQKFGFILEDE
ncbi:hypothetical protein EXIGLDRAFT_587914, partial [Exidia glandulosa HHB12029]